MDIETGESPVIPKPITLEDLKKWDRSITVICRFLATVNDPELHGHLDAVLGLAHDRLCNTCYDVDVDPYTMEYCQPGCDYEDGDVEIDEGRIISRSITLEDLKEWEGSIGKVYRFHATVNDPKLHRHLDLVLGLAHDELYEIRDGIDACTPKQ